MQKDSPSPEGAECISFVESLLQEELQAGIPNVVRLRYALKADTWQDNAGNGCGSVPP
jgi:hypothetical protein